MKSNHNNNTPDTLESVSALIKELALSFDARMKASDEKFEKERAEARIQMKNLREMLGGMGNSHGMFAEEFFFNAIDNGDKYIFGEQFDDCVSSSKRYHKDKQLKSERDIMLFNCNAIAFIEVKYKARREDIQKLIDRLPVIKSLYPEYKSHRIYLGLAAMSFEDNVEKYTKEAGIAIVKQVGETIVIDDGHLKVF